MEPELHLSTPVRFTHILTISTSKTHGRGTFLPKYTEKGTLLPVGCETLASAYDKSETVCLNVSPSFLFYFLY
jgi:hypothetical protein